MALQGICTDTSETAQLIQDKKYFLFPNGTTHYYVSKFPRQGAHFGCFRKSLFQVIQEDEWPPEPEEIEVHIDRNKVYTGELVWRNKTYQTTIGDRYYLKPLKKLAHVYSDKEFTKHRGCYPLHWFKDFAEFELEPDKTVIEAEESEHIMLESVQISDMAGQYEQLSLF